MHISALQPRALDARPNLRQASVSQSESEPPPELTPDFVTLDSAEEAMLLPILDPAFQWALANSVSGDLLGPEGSVALHYQSKMGKAQIQQNFKIQRDEKDGTLTLMGFGTVAQEPGFDAATLKNDQAAWQGGYGANTYSLNFVKNKETGEYEGGGSLGNLALKMKFDVSDSGISTEGVIGGRQFRQLTLQQSPTSLMTAGQIEANQTDGPNSMLSKTCLIEHSAEWGEPSTVIAGRGIVGEAIQVSELRIQSS